MEANNTVPAPILPETLSAALSPEAISYPSPINYHAISDDELDTLVATSSSVQANIAYTSLGAFASSIPGAIPALRSLANGDAMQVDAGTWLMVACVTLTITVVCGINGIRNQGYARRLVTEIR